MKPSKCSVYPLPPPACPLTDQHRKVVIVLDLEQFSDCSIKSTEAKLRSFLFCFGVPCTFHFRESSTAINVFQKVWSMAESFYQLLTAIKPSQSSELYPELFKSLQAVFANNHYTIIVLSFLLFKVFPIMIMSQVVVGVKWSRILKKETTMPHWKESWLMSKSFFS